MKSFLFVLCLILLVLFSSASPGTGKWDDIERQLTLLREYNGPVRGSAALTLTGIVFVGLLGMFAAVVGALLGSRMWETVDDGDINASIWAESDDEDCEPSSRERVYEALRMAGADYV